MKVSRSFAPLTLYIENEKDLNFLVNSLHQAQEYLMQKGRWGYRQLLRTDEEAYQDITALIHKLKGN